MKNSVEEPDNVQGEFEKALRRLSEKLDHFHCPICHAEDGITFIDDPFFVMHYDWDKTQEPWPVYKTVLVLLSECPTGQSKQSGT